MNLDATSRLEKKSEAVSRLEKKSERTNRETRRKSMDSVSVASHGAPSFLASLLKEHSITDVNLVADNAKSRATFPRSVYYQFPKSDRENKSASRWDSIVRTESRDSRDHYGFKRNHSRRISGEVNSLSPSPLNRVVERRGSLPSIDCKPDKDLYEKLNSSAPCLNYRGSYGSSNLTDLLRQDLRGMIATDDNIRTPQDRIRYAQKLFGPLPPPMRQESDESISGTSSSSSKRKPERRGSLGAVDRPNSVRERSSSDPTLRVPQRRAFIDSQEESGPSKPRRARRTASMNSVSTRKEQSPTKSAKPSVSTWWQLGGKNEDGDSDGNLTDSTHELTPLPSTCLDNTSKIRTRANDFNENPPLNTPPRRKATRRSSMPSNMPSSKKKSTRPKSPPLDQPGTPPSIRHRKRSSKEKKKKKKRFDSPPPPQPGTPPSPKVERRSRRHSDSIIDIDMEVGKKLLHLAQISFPVQPIRCRSFRAKEGNNAENKTKPDSFTSIATVIDSASDGPDDQAERVLEKSRQYIQGDVDNTSQQVEGKFPINSEEVESKPLEEGGTEIPPRRERVHFALEVNFSTSKKTLPNRVSFSPRRMHSAPIAGQDPRKEDDESASLSPFRRGKPFSPGKSFASTGLTATKTGAFTRTRTNSTRDGGQNRDIILTSLYEHSSKGDDFVLDGNDSSSSMDESKTIADLLPPALSLDTPPQVMKKTKNRRSSLPLASDLNESHSQTTKKKSSRRRSLY